LSQQWSPTRNTSAPAPAITPEWPLPAISPIQPGRVRRRQERRPARLPEEP
jgi:hypothetical protein